MQNIGGPKAKFGYQAIAASQTDKVLGGTGAVGDFLERLIITPGVAAAGAVSIKDGGGSSIPIFAGGATTALDNLMPVSIAIGMVSTGGAWKVTTGGDVTVVAVGNFTP